MPGPFSLMLAEGSIPRLPVSIDASSDRMSPNRLAVTIVSNTLGFRRSCMAALSMYLQITACGQRSCGIPCCQRTFQGLHVGQLHVWILWGYPGDHLLPEL